MLYRACNFRWSYFVKRLSSLNMYGIFLERKGISMNRFEQRSKIAYDKKAVNYDISLEGKYTEDFKTFLMDVVQLQPGYHVLDVACGNGRLLKQFSEKNAIAGYGADLSENMIREAKLLNPNMTFSVGTCDEIPYADQTFDVITVSAAYHHFPHVTRFASEAYRLLKDGGTIYIAEVFYPSLVRILCNPLVPLMKDGDVRFYSPREIIRTLGKAGFQNPTFQTRGHIQVVCATKPQVKTESK